MNSCCDFLPTEWIAYPCYHLGTVLRTSLNFLSAIILCVNPIFCLGLDGPRGPPGEEGLPGFSGAKGDSGASIPGRPGECPAVVDNRYRCIEQHCSIYSVTFNTLMKEMIICISDLIITIWTLNLIYIY